MGIETALVGGGAMLGSGLLGGSEQGGTTQTTQTSSPWSGVQPYLHDIFGRAQDAAVNFPYTGPKVSGDATNQIGATIRGDYLSPDTNPFLRASVQDALGLAGSTFAGQYGGQAGQNLGNSGYQEALARGLGATATNAYANAYGQERQNQLNASQFAPALDTSNQMAQFGPLQAYASILGLGTGGGTSTTQTPYFTNPTAGALGGALAGGQLAGMMGGFGSPSASGGSSAPSSAGGGGISMTAPAGWGGLYGWR